LGRTGRFADAAGRGDTDARAFVLPDARDEGFAAAAVLRDGDFFSAPGFAAARDLVLALAMTDLPALVCIASRAAHRG
jgi:hypothetical protein